MTPTQALTVAVVQGATELFPVSSLGHAVILPRLLGWNLDQHGPAFLPFLVMLHLGTAAALLAYFWREWWALLRGTIGIGEEWHTKESRRVVMLLVVATLPAVLIGGALEHVLRAVFGTPVLAAVFLAINGLVLIGGERLRAARATRGGKRPLSSLTWLDALVIGLWQCLALLPGISRSGTTIVGGLLRGIDHENAAHFSFLIALPVILAATVIEVPKLASAQVAPGTFQLAGICAIVAGVIAFLSTALLMRYFKNNDDWALGPFAIYCIVAGLGSIAYLELA